MGESEAPGGGRGRFFFFENPREGVGEREGPMGPGGCLRRIGEFWGAKCFFSGPKRPPRFAETTFSMRTQRLFWGYFLK